MGAEGDRNGEGMRRWRWIRSGRTGWMREGRDILHLDISKHPREDLMSLYHHSPATALVAIMYILWPIRA